MRNKESKKEEKVEKNINNNTEESTLDNKEENTEKEINVDYKDMYLRALADYDNLRKDTANQRTEWIKFANSNLLSEIIPVMDNFKIAVDHVPADKKDDPWLVGITYIRDQLKKVLEDNGVEEISNVVGQKFNPELHEAMEDNNLNKEDFKDYKEGDIIKELRAGYKMHGKVISHAKVIVK